MKPSGFTTFVLAGGLLLTTVAAAPLDWHDIDGDGLDGRRQAIAERCSGGLCLDQYSGEVIPESEAEVDHILPRKRAEVIFGNGLAAWRNFVNWQGNLAITSRTTNRSKGAKGPEKFCPKLVGARAWYADRFEGAARRSNLPLTPSEASALAELRQGRCAEGAGR